MSLEQAIDRLAAAIEKLAENSAPVTVPGTTSPKASGKGKDKTDPTPAPAEKPEASAPGPATAPADAAQSSSEKNASPSVEGTPIDFKKDVVPKFMALIEAKGNAAGRKIIDHFDASKARLSEAVVTPEQCAKCLKLIKDAMV
jgi:hypothetical protein